MTRTGLGTLLAVVAFGMTTAMAQPVGVRLSFLMISR